jgi:hypothetical protein
MMFSRIAIRGVPPKNLIARLPASDRATNSINFFLDRLRLILRAKDYCCSYEIS